MSDSGRYERDQPGVSYPEHGDPVAASSAAVEPAPPKRIKPTLLARCPAMAAVLCFIAGILLHEHVPILVGLWLLVCACMCIAALVAPWHAAGNACLALAILAAGLAAAQMARFQFSGGHIGHYLGDDPRLAWLEVRIDETPRLLRTPEAAMPRPPKLVCLAQVTRLRAWDGWRPAQGDALLQFDSPSPQVRAGDTLRIFGLVERPGEAMNPGQFDFAAYYRASGVLASISVDGPHNVTLVHRDSPPMLTRARDQVRDWLCAGFEAGAQEEAAILRALLLGERDPVMSDAREAFRKSGTSHHLAISGMHIAIVGGVVLGLMRLVGFGPRTSLVAGAVTVAVYGLLALPSAPVIRATVLALTFCIGLLAGRRGSGVQLLAVAALVVLLLNPLDLYRAGFQLTFVTVMGLMLFATPLQRRFIGSDGAGDADLLRRKSEHSLIRVTHWLDARMLKALAAAIIAWLVAMPLVAVHFEQFNPWAIPASLISAPLVFASLIGGVLKVVLTAVAPGASELWADCAAIPVTWMLGVVEWFAARPGADVPLPTPALPPILLFYAGALLWLVRWPTAGLTWLARAPSGVACLLVFVLPFTTSPAVASRPLRVTVLAVGAGQCVVIETPGGRVAMIDVGSTSLGDPLEKCVSPFLRTRGHTRVDLLVLSHANWDHYGGAAELTRRYGVGEVVVGPNFASDARAFASGRRVLDELVHLDRPPRILDVGDVMPLGRQTQLEVIWPPTHLAELSSNDSSLVVRLEHAGRSILFSGDIQEEAMRRLLALAESNPGLLRADVLIAPHHGSSEDVTARFIDAVDPAWIISSNGRVLSQKQRRFEQMTGPRPLLRTHQAGAVTVQVGEQGQLDVQPFLGGRRRSLSYSE